MTKYLFVLSLFCLSAWSSIGQKSDSIKSIAKKEKKIKTAFYPALGYTPETGVNLGVIAFFVMQPKDTTSEFSRPTVISPYIIWTTNKQFLTSIEYETYLPNGININSQLRVFKFPDKYFGTGPEVEKDTYESLEDNYFSLEGSVLKTFNQKSFFGLQYDWQYNKIANVVEGGMLETQDPVGRSGGWNMGIGPVMTIDTRDNTLYPKKGSYLLSGFNFYGKGLGGDFNYGVFNFDYRQYFRTFIPKNVIAYQVQTNFTLYGDIPFYKMNQIGGAKRLRGIDHKNLYRDKHSVFVQVEARQELFWRLGGVIYAGTGKTFGTESELEEVKPFDDLTFIYGLGGRFNALKDEKLNVRLDLGFTSDGQSAFYLSVKEAF
ncbi:MAG: outer membrane protein assembly factor [Reichenbachiella sp.]